MIRSCYEVVTTNGHGVHRRCATLGQAQRTAARLAGNALVDFGPFEIQHVVEYGDGGRRYWMRSGSQWVPWDVRQGFDERKPDWWWPSADAAESTRTQSGEDS